MSTLTKLAALAVAGTIASAGASYAAVVDTIDATNGGPGTYFVPNLGQELDSPYYRGYGQDWGWTHNAIAVPFTTAELSISAYDVDEPSEVDEIYVSNNGTLELLGTLTGDNNAFSFTTFTLGADLFDDIAAGLEVFMKIDVGTKGSWLVSLGKSVITTDGEDPGNPNPGGVVPLPAGGFLLLTAIGGLAATRRRKKA